MKNGLGDLRPRNGHDSTHLPIYFLSSKPSHVSYWRGRQAGARAGRSGDATVRRPALLENYLRASRIKLNGVSVARRNCVKPASSNTSRSRSSPACAPSARPTSCESEFGVQTMVEAA